MALDENIPWEDITVHESGGFYETWGLQDENGTAVDITGDTFEAHVRATFSTSAALLLDISPSIESATGGTILWNVSEANVATLTTGADMVYDLFHTVSGTPPQKICRGRFIKESSATDTA